MPRARVLLLRLAQGPAHRGRVAVHLDPPHTHSIAMGIRRRYLHELVCFFSPRSQAKQCDHHGQPRRQGRGLCGVEALRHDRKRRSSRGTVSSPGSLITFKAMIGSHSEGSMHTHPQHNPSLTPPPPITTTTTAGTARSSHYEGSMQVG